MDGEMVEDGIELDWVGLLRCDAGSVRVPLACESEDVTIDLRNDPNARLSQLVATMNVFFSVSGPVVCRVATSPVMLNASAGGCMRKKESDILTPKRRVCKSMSNNRNGHIIQPTTSNDWEEEQV